MAARAVVREERDAFDVTCATCSQKDGNIVALDPLKGFLIVHPRRPAFPCRVSFEAPPPLGE